MDRQALSIPRYHETWGSDPLHFDATRWVLNEGKKTVTRTNDRKPIERFNSLTVVVCTMAAGFLLMAGLLRLADERAPQAGDIIAFRATRVPSVSTASLAVGRAIAASSMSCILDVQTMQRSGGSLVVETVQLKPSQMFRVHWAGVRTSSGDDDCGSAADILLNSNQIGILTFAAGGTGVNPKN